METTNNTNLPETGFQEIDAKPSGLRWGAIGGVAVVLYGVIRYVISIDVYISWGWVMASYVIIIAAMVLAAWEVKNKQKNYISFKKALQASFLASVISLIIYSAFAFIMSTQVDTNINKYSKAKAMEFNEKVLEASGASEEEIEKQLENIEDMDFNQTIGQFLIGLASQIIVGFMYALIIAGLFHYAFKDNKPVVLNSPAEEQGAL